MRDREYAEVIGAGGHHGYIVGPSEAHPEEVAIAFDDGREVSVPMSSLRREADGTWHLLDETEQEVVPILAEELKVAKRKRATGTVRVGADVTERQETVSMPLASERAHVRRVLIDKPISEMPQIRREGDTIIFPVVEEVPVVHKQLVLKEELHVSRKRTIEQHEETVTLREEHANVERIDDSGRRTRLIAPEPVPQRSILDPAKPRPSILGPNPKNRPATRNKILRGE